jgi:hypothetical protein
VDEPLVPAGVAKAGLGTSHIVQYSYFTL